jgi:putative transposase
VDFGIVNIATDSDGQSYSGSQIRSVRHRHRRLRRKLQKKQTRAAKRRLKKLSGKEQRFATHTNHVIAKQIVALAKRTQRAIALEELQGIRLLAQATSSSA